MYRWLLSTENSLAIVIMQLLAMLAPFVFLDLLPANAADPGRCRYRGLYYYQPLVPYFNAYAKL